MGTKKCKKCGEEKELNVDNFSTRQSKSKKPEASGKKIWHSYCRQCRRKTRIGEYQRYKPSEEKRMWKRGYQKMYGETMIGRSIRLLKSYRVADKKKGYDFNLTQDWFIENVLKKECLYCGSVSQLGADRIDNTKGHTTENTIPCCAVCNSVRSDIFSVEEMKEIGMLIKGLRLKRDIIKISGNLKKAKDFVPYCKPEIINQKVA